MQNRDSEAPRTASQDPSLSHKKKKLEISDQVPLMRVKQRDSPVIARGPLNLVGRRRHGVMGQQETCSVGGNSEALSIITVLNSYEEIYQE